MGKKSNSRAGKAALLISMVALLFVLAFYSPYDLRITGQASRIVQGGSTSGFVIIALAVVVALFFVHKYLNQNRPV